MTFQFMLAPMDNFTDNAFRALCYKYGADMTFTSMLSIEALARKNEQTWKELNFEDNDAPVVIQLIGNKEESLKKFLTIFKPSHCFRGFNLNCGCIDPEVIQNGNGCALMKRVTKVAKLVNIIKEKGYPVSVKMRLGLNQYEKEKKVYLNLTKNVNADFFIVHARHGKETYKDPADFSVYPEVVATGKKIIARGAVENPQIFNLLKKKKVLDKEAVKKDYLYLAEKYHSSERNKKNILRRLE